MSHTTPVSHALTNLTESFLLSPSSYGSRPKRPLTNFDIVLAAVGTILPQSDFWTESLIRKHITVMHTSFTRLVKTRGETVSARMPGRLQPLRKLKGGVDSCRSRADALAVRVECTGSGRISTKIPAEYDEHAVRQKHLVPCMRPCVYIPSVRGLKSLVLNESRNTLDDRSNMLDRTSSPIVIVG